MKLCIDGDWLAYSVACAMEAPYPFDDSGKKLFDFGLAKRVVDGKIDKWIDLLEGTDVVVHFSCNREDNWRRDVLPEYKMNRKDIEPPVGLKPMIEYLSNMYETVTVPRLEADDTLGIMGTSEKDVILVSVDKDFLTIPTKIYNPNKEVLKKQSRVGAFKSFIYQTLIGDATDGYKGLKRIGPKKALAFIKKHEKALYNIWEPMVELAEKQGHDEEYLLTQAQVAHILQAGDYDFEEGTVRHWVPNLIPEMLEN